MESLFLNNEYDLLVKNKKISNKLLSGINKYRVIQKLHNEKNYDKIFQKTFKGFYRVRRDQEFIDKSIEILKSNNQDFRSVINLLSKLDGIAEISFASKLVHTVNNDLPIYDSFVAKNLNLKKQKSNCTISEKILDRITIYEELCSKQKDILNDPKTMSILKKFSKDFECEDISDAKKIDFLLWVMRSN